MRLHSVCLLTAAVAGTAFAQQWELGAGGGIGVSKNLTVTRGSQTAEAGFKPGAAFSAYAGQNMSDRFGGQFRYTFQFNDMKLSSGGTDVTFSALSHAVHYDLLFFGAGREAKVRPFLAGGGGVKYYRGTGKETVLQPLSQFAILTKTSETKGLITFGGGVKVRVGNRSFVTLEARDYLTPAPKLVLAPVPGAKMDGWIHDFVPMVSLSFGF